MAQIDDEWVRTRTAGWKRRLVYLSFFRSRNINRTQDASPIHILPDRAYELGKGAPNW